MGGGVKGAGREREAGRGVLVPGCEKPIPIANVRSITGRRTSVFSGPHREAAGTQVTAKNSTRREKRGEETEDGRRRGKKG